MLLILYLDYAMKIDDEPARDFRSKIHTMTLRSPQRHSALISPIKRMRLQSPTRAATTQMSYEPKSSEDVSMRSINSPYMLSDVSSRTSPVKSSTFNRRDRRDEPGYELRRRKPQ